MGAGQPSRERCWVLQSRAGCWEALEAEVGRAAAGAWAFRAALLGQPEATHGPPLTAPHSRLTVDRGGFRGADRASCVSDRVVGEPRSGFLRNEGRGRNVEDVGPLVRPGLGLHDPGTQVLKVIPVPVRPEGEKTKMQEPLSLGTPGRTGLRPTQPRVEGDVEICLGGGSRAGGSRGPWTGTEKTAVIFREDDPSPGNPQRTDG